MNSRWFAPLIFASAVLGWLAAVSLPDVVWLEQLTQLLRTAFFSALKMVIAPLIFFSLIAGVMQLRASRQMGRLGSVTIAYYLTTTGIAVSWASSAERSSDSMETWSLSSSEMVRATVGVCPARSCSRSISQSAVKS